MSTVLAAATAASTAGPSIAEEIAFWVVAPIAVLGAVIGVFDPGPETFV